MIETGYFYFNTEAHPVDGASLECCRVLRDPQSNENLNLEDLLDKYLKMSLPDHQNEDENKKTMRQEYQEIKEKMKSKLEKNELCEETNQTKLSNVTLNEKNVNMFPLSCSLDDSFEINTNLFNNLNFYP